MERVTERLKLVLPITLCLVLLLFYLNTGSLTKTTLIMLAVRSRDLEMARELKRRLASASSRREVAA